MTDLIEEIESYLALRDRIAESARRIGESYQMMNRGEWIEATLEALDGTVMGQESPGVHSAASSCKFDDHRTDRLTTAIQWVSRKIKEMLSKRRTGVEPATSSLGSMDRLSSSLKH